MRAHSGKHARPRVHRTLWWVGGFVLAAAALWLIAKFLLAAAPGDSLPKPQQVTVLRLPPPPPPPPKPPEKPPEPPKIKEEVKLEPPKPADEPKAAKEPDAPPPGPLGLDAQGTGPGDGFGLAGRPGGRDITIGGSGGGGGLSSTLFANGVARSIAQELARVGGLRSIEYRIDLDIWLARDGRIERHVISRSSGDPAVDRLVGEGLARMVALRQPPPEGMAQPLRIRVTSADG